MDIKNPANYKLTHKTDYSVWCALPKKGTPVYNKLEQFEAHTSDSHPLVLSGTGGELWVNRISKVIEAYTFEDGSEITEQALEELKTDGVIDWFKIKTKPTSANKWACFVPAEEVFQVQIGAGLAWCNKPAEGITHGLGDFIVCSDKDGAPDIETGYVVNGAVFACTYDTTNFEDCVEHPSNVQDIPTPTMKII